MAFLEICIDHPQSALAAEMGGADRIELTSALMLGGLSPNPGLFKIVRSLTTLPIYTMIRPRIGDFCYSELELKTMEDDIFFAINHGTDGLVFGCLTPDLTIDKKALTRLMQASHGLPVTFHRAFDLIADQEAALETLIEAGVKTVLTSGGCPSAENSIDKLKNLHKQADGRITIMAGGGVNESNIKKIMQETGINTLHASAKKVVEKENSYTTDLLFNSDVSTLEKAHWESDQKRVQTLKSLIS